MILYGNILERTKNMKTEKTNKSFTEYLEALDESHKDTILALDKMLIAKYGETNRFIWEGIFWGGSEQSIIGYGEYDTKRKDGATWFMVGLAIQKNHYSLYINAVEDNQYLVKKYAAELGKVKIGSSSIGFTNLDVLHLETLKKVIDISYEQWLALKN